MSLIRRPTNEEAADVAASVLEDRNNPNFTPNKGDFTSLLSTGSTLLDLAICGGVVRGGGIPGGIMMEIFGPSGSGKTSLLAEICASAIARKGRVRIGDPEGRLNKEYCEKFGLYISPDDYYRPDTVKEVFEDMEEWGTNEDGKIDVYACDSIAALSTEMEMESEDKMGGKRAKDFSAGLRKTARIIAKDNRLVVFTNQVRQKMGITFGSSETTGGGMAIPFYASIRIRIGVQEKIERKVKVVKEEKKIIGIKSECYIAKSSVDEPYRVAPVYIMFNYGVDDIRANLQWLKDHTTDSNYGILEENQRGYNSMNDAIKMIENDPKNIQALKNKVITIWEQIDAKLTVSRQPKVRF